MVAVAAGGLDSSICIACSGVSVESRSSMSSAIRTDCEQVSELGLQGVGGAQLGRRRTGKYALRRCTAILESAGWLARIHTLTTRNLCAKCCGHPCSKPGRSRVTTALSHLRNALRPISPAPCEAGDKRAKPDKRTRFMPLVCKKLVSWCLRGASHPAAP